MPTFSAPMIDLYSRDLSKAVAFYSVLGFVETLRTRSAASPSMSSSSWTGSRSELRRSRPLRNITAVSLDEKAAGSK